MRGRASSTGAWDEIDAALGVLERRTEAGDSLPLVEAVEQALFLTRRVLLASIEAAGDKPLPGEAADILEVFRVLVKGESSWNAIRDNCRELVYYRNCIDMDREDALPRAPAKMAVRTARHVYLYAKTRCIREGRLFD